MGTIDDIVFDEDWDEGTMGMSEDYDYDLPEKRGKKMQGVVQAKEFSKKGAPKFKVNGIWYYAGKTKVDGLEVGHEIEFESSTFGDTNNLHGFNWWKPVPRQQSQGYPDQGYPASQRQGQSAANPQPAASTITDYNILQSVSNIVGRIGQAGMIKTPEDLEKWCVAARMGLSRAMSHAKYHEPDQEPDFDDKIPF